MKFLVTVISIFPFWLSAQDNLCDSIIISEKALNGFHLEATFKYDTILSYAGFVLHDEFDQLVAIQNGGNFYGIIGNGYQTRYPLSSSQSQSQSIETPFKGTLILINGLQAGAKDTVCTYPYILDDVTTSIVSHQNKDKELINITDLNGNKTTIKPYNILLYHYTDGSCQKVFIKE
jgi:hypothetical protein